MGKTHEARRWLLKAHSWLDPLGGEMPPNAEKVSLHLHNWLEAQIIVGQARLPLTGSR